MKMILVLTLISSLLVVLNNNVRTSFRQHKLSSICFLKIMLISTKIILMMLIFLVIFQHVIVDSLSFCSST
jgi:hypothetical protein